jgi:hypothetical protein
VGNYFLSVAVGHCCRRGLARRIMARRGLSFLLVFACSLSCVTGLPGAGVAAGFAWWRVAGLLVLGIGAGLLNMALFHAISRNYQRIPPTPSTMGGVWYGLGLSVRPLCWWPAPFMAGYTCPKSWHSWRSSRRFLP